MLASRATHWQLRIAAAEVIADAPFSPCGGIARWIAVACGGSLRKWLREQSCVLDSSSAPLCFDAAEVPFAERRAVDVTATRGALALHPGHLTLTDLWALWRGPVPLGLPDSARATVLASATTIQAIVDRGEAACGVNTGFGKLAKTRIPDDQLALLQRNVILSHAVGTGETMSDATGRLIMAVKAASLAWGLSGVRPVVVDTHLALVAAGIVPLTLAAEERLVLINGTPVSMALALHALFTAERLPEEEAITGALSVDAAWGSDVPFDPRIYAARAAGLGRDGRVHAHSVGGQRDPSHAPGPGRAGAGSLLPAAGAGAWHAPRRGAVRRRRPALRARHRGGLATRPGRSGGGRTAPSVRSAVVMTVRRRAPAGWPSGPKPAPRLRRHRGG